MSFLLKTGHVFLCSVIWDYTLDTVNVMLHRASSNSQESWVFPADNHPSRAQIARSVCFCWAVTLVLVQSASWALPYTRARERCYEPWTVVWSYCSSEPMLCLWVCPAQAQLGSNTKTCVGPHTHRKGIPYSSSPFWGFLLALLARLPSSSGQTD